jgi:periplasmic divalent cation tolerance protein
MNLEKLCIVYITASNKDEAVKIGDELVLRRLAACTNVIDKVTSFYWWEGKRQNDEEALILAKTKESLLPELKKAIKEIHSYSCPCIEAIPVIDASDDYASWVISETKK